MTNQKIKKWRVGIFGTEYDQEYLNEIAQSQIDDNVELIYFLKPKEFGKNSDVHPHESCVKSVSSCDIAFFFVNRRYGGSYQGRKFFEEHPADWPFELSVTHAEYRKAKIERIPTVVFVHSESWREVADVFLRVKKGDSSDRERYELVKKTWEKDKHYVKDPEVYCFIREAIRGLGREQSYQSWKAEYSDADLVNSCSKLREKMLNELRSLTPYILRKLANKQYDALRKELRIGPRISYQFMEENECLVDRETQNESGQRVKDVSDCIRGESNHVTIIGDAHAGKTFLMIKLFGEDVETCSKVSGKDIPVFFNFKNRPKGTFDLESIIASELSSYFSVRGYPYNFDTVHLRLYIDGVGEGEYINTEQLKRFFTILLSSNKNVRLIITVRREYYDLNYTNFNEIFEGQVEIHRLVKIEANEGKRLIQDLLRTLGSNENLKGFNLAEVIPENSLREPMHCVMAAYILSTGLPKFRRGELNALRLYDDYIKLLVEHEVTHVPGSLTFDDLYRAWQDTAHIIAWGRTKGDMVDCNSLRKRLMDKGHSVTAWERTRSSLIESDVHYAQFKYDSYMESLLSRMIINYILQKKGSEDILAIDCYYDRSVFIENRFSQLGHQQVNRVLQELFMIACKHIFKKDEIDTRITSNCVYLMALLGCRQRPETFDVDDAMVRIRALRELTLRKLMKNSFVYIGALFQLTRLGDYGAEKELDRELKIENIRKRNVDFHLAYFGAIQSSWPFPPNVTAPEDGIDCSRLLDGIARHFRREEERYLLRVRIDITIVCDALEIYHCYYSKESALKWIGTFEDLVSSIRTNHKHLQKLIEGSKSRLSISRKKIE